jgi:hypothetical protein
VDLGERAVGPEAPLISGVGDVPQPAMPAAIMAVKTSTNQGGRGGPGIGRRFMGAWTQQRWFAFLQAGGR